MCFGQIIHEEVVILFTNYGVKQPLPIYVCILDDIVIIVPKKVCQAQRWSSNANAYVDGY